jgi:hypothetical protein
MMNDDASATPTTTDEPSALRFHPICWSPSGFPMIEAPVDRAAFDLDYLCWEPGDGPMPLTVVVEDAGQPGRLAARYDYGDRSLASQPGAFPDDAKIRADIAGWGSPIGGYLAEIHEFRRGYRDERGWQVDADEGLARRVEEVVREHGIGAVRGAVDRVDPGGAVAGEPDHDAPPPSAGAGAPAIDPAQFEGHTPGPWSIWQHYSNGCATTLEIWAPDRTAPDRKWVADITGATYLGNANGADAALIAAAPTLLSRLASAEADRDRLAAEVERLTGPDGPAARIVAAIEWAAENTASFGLDTQARAFREAARIAREAGEAAGLPKIDGSPPIAATGKPGGES